MYDALCRWVLALLKVPPQPNPPFGEPASLQVFRAGRNYYRLRMAGWAAAQVLVLGAFLFWTAILVEVEAQVHEQEALRAAPPSGEMKTEPIPPGDNSTRAQGARRRTRNAVETFANNIRTAATKAAVPPASGERRGVRSWVAGYKQFFVEVALMLPPWVFPLLWVVKMISFAIYLVQIPLTYAVRRLDYEMRWYMVTDRSLRLRHGVWRVAESTMSFANIQQVVVTQGPLQRLLGLADLKVQSAGGGSTPHEAKTAGDDMHVGLFRHVTNAPAIRDLILDRLRRFRESGIGDPDDASTGAVAPASSAPTQAVTAAHELLAEARALRSMLS